MEVTGKTVGNGLRWFFGIVAVLIATSGALHPLWALLLYIFACWCMIPLCGKREA